MKRNKPIRFPDRLPKKVKRNLDLSVPLNRAQKRAVKAGGCTELPDGHEVIRNLTESLIAAEAARTDLTRQLQKEDLEHLFPVIPEAATPELREVLKSGDGLMLIVGGSDAFAMSLRERLMEHLPDLVVLDSRERDPEHYTPYCVIGEHALGEGSPLIEFYKKEKT